MRRPPSQARVEAWLRRYAALPAFAGARPRLAGLRVVVKFNRRRHFSTAWAYSRRLTLTIGYDPHEARVTILHELAHLATWRRTDHGRAWRRVYWRALGEALQLERARVVDFDAVAYEALRERRGGIK